MDQRFRILFSFPTLGYTQAKLLIPRFLRQNRRGDYRAVRAMDVCRVSATLG